MLSANLQSRKRYIVRRDIYLSLSHRVGTVDSAASRAASIAQAVLTGRAGGATPKGKAAEHPQQHYRAKKPSGFFCYNPIKLYQSTTFPHC